MIWEKYQLRDWVYWEAAFTEMPATREALIDVFSELWSTFIAKAIPMHAPNTWEVCRVEIWLDSGKIVLLPSLRGSTRYTHNAACEVIVEDLRLKIEKVIFSNEDPALVEAEMEKQQSLYSDYLFEAALRMEVGKSIGREHTILEFWLAEAESPFRIEDL